MLCCSDCHVVQHHIIHTCRQQTFWPNQSYCSIKALSNQEIFFFHLLSIKQSLPAASLLEIHTANSRTKSRAATSFLSVFICIFVLWVFVAFSFPDAGTSHHTIKYKHEECVCVCVWELRTGSQCVQLETTRFTLRQLIKYHRTRGERRAAAQQQQLINTLNFAEADRNTHTHKSLKTATSSAVRNPGEWPPAPPAAFINNHLQ